MTRIDLSQTILELSITVMQLQFIKCSVQRFFSLFFSVLCPSGIKKEADARDGVDNDHTTLIITFAFKRLQKKPVADWLIDFVCELILRYYSQNRDGAQSKADRPGKPSSSQEKKKKEAPLHRQNDLSAH